MNTKKCFKCGEIKNLSDFYRHSKMLDGHVNKCKECNKKDVRDNRKDKIEYYREYDANRGSRTTADNKRNYRNKYPMKYAAHIMIANALRDGRLKKSEQCQECGKEHEHIHGHHDDYAKPLVVRWLCPPCHFKWHTENGEALNAN